MGKDDVLMLLETDMQDPGAHKSGEHLETHVLSRCLAVLQTDRPGLIAALHEWLHLRTEPRTMLAVRLAGRLGLRELATDITALRQDVVRRRAFPTFYLAYLDEALERMRASG